MLFRSVHFRTSLSPSVQCLLVALGATVLASCSPAGDTGPAFNNNPGVTSEPSGTASGPGQPVGDPSGNVGPGGEPSPSNEQPGGNEPNPTVTPGGNEPNPTVTPGGNEPNPTVTPSGNEPNPTVTPGGNEPNPTVSPGGSPQPNPTSTPTGPVFIDEDDGGELVNIDDPNQPTEGEEGEILEGAVCSSGDSELNFEPVVPTVMLVLDRSTSMFRPNLPNGASPSPFGAYDDRWEALRAAVASLEPYASEVQFGAMTYTGYNINTQNGGACPELQGLDIEIGMGNFSQITALLPPSEQAIPPAKSETPTAEGLEAAIEVLSAVQTDGPKYIVLVTDGLPEMCAGNPELLDKGNWCGHDPAFAVVQNAYMNGITTYVIGIIGQGTNQDENAAGEYFLNGIAHAGQGLPIVAPTDNLHCIQQESRIARGAEPANDFYSNWRPWAAAEYGESGLTYSQQLYFAPSDNNLGQQLAQVVEATRSCEFELSNFYVVRDQAHRGGVAIVLDGGVTQVLTYEDANGWSLHAERDDVIVVHGSACAGVQSSQQSAGLKIEFPCDENSPTLRIK